MISEHFLYIIKSHSHIQPHLIYLHNYYPYLETGLSRAFFQEQNACIRYSHSKANIDAFTPEASFYCPIYEGLLRY
ncbi:MupG family TIM beta-alpha barrel fold protein [Staphylococcus hyicus]|uniref:MupG family TIM beta-alpha barrel fold protein n=1 Tax=Staphylococcus hyicus TaxID=1284 RepID=UPI003B75C0B6